MHRRLRGACACVRPRPPPSPRTPAIATSPSPNATIPPARTRRLVHSTPRHHRLHSTQQQQRPQQHPQQHPQHPQQRLLHKEIHHRKDHSESLVPPVRPASPTGSTHESSHTQSDAPITRQLEQLEQLPPHQLQDNQDHPPEQNHDSSAARCGRSLWRRFLALTARPADPALRIPAPAASDIALVLDSLITLGPNSCPANAARICEIALYLHARGLPLADHQLAALACASSIAAASFASTTSHSNNNNNHQQDDYHDHQQDDHHDHQQDDYDQNHSPSLPIAAERYARQAAVAHIAHLGPAASRILSRLVFTHLLAHNAASDRSSSPGLAAATAILDTMYHSCIAPDARALAACVALVRISNSTPSHPCSALSRPAPSEILVRQPVSEFAKLTLVHFDQSHNFDPSSPLALEAELEFLCSSLARFHHAKDLFESIDFASMSDHAYLITACHRHMIQGYVIHERNLADAEETFSDLVRVHKIVPDRSSYIAMLRARYTLGDREQVMAMYHAMLTAGHAPDDKAYAILIRAHALEGDLDAAFLVFDALKKRASPITTNEDSAASNIGLPILTALLIAIVRSQDVTAMKNAEDFFQEHIMGKFYLGTDVFNIMIYGYARRCHLSLMSVWFDRLLAAGCKPDAVTYSILNYGVLNARQHAKSIGSPESALEALNTEFERKSGISVTHVRSAVSDTIVLNHYLHTQKIAHALSWFESAFEIPTLSDEDQIDPRTGMRTIKWHSVPDVVTYTSIMAAYVRDGDYASAMSLFDFMQSGHLPGFRLTRDIYHQLVRIMTSTPGKEQRAYSIYLSMLSNRISPDDITIFRLIRTFLNARQPEYFDTVMTRSVFGLHVPRSQQIYLRIMDLLINTWSWPPAVTATIRLFRDINQRGVDTDSQAITAAVQYALSIPQDAASLPIVFAVANEAVQYPRLLPDLPTPDMIITLCHAITDHNITMEHVVVFHDADVDITDTDNTDNDHDAIKRDTNKTSLEHTLITLIEKSLDTGVLTDASVLETCIRKLGGDKRSDLIYAVWCAVCQASVRGIDSSVDSINDVYDDDDQQHQQREHQQQQQQGGLCVVDFPAHLAALVIEQLGIYARDEEITRVVWNHWIRSNGMTTTSIRTDTINDTCTDTRTDTTQRRVSHVTEPQVWAFVRVLIWWGYADEAIDLATTGLDRLGLVSYDRLVRQLMDWFVWKNDVGDGRRRFVSYWGVRRPDLVQQH